MKYLFILMACIFTSTQASDLIKNGEFKNGKSGWSGEGRVVFLNEANEELSQEQEGYFPVLKISLNRSEWSLTTHNFKTAEGQESILVHVEVMPSKDYKKSDNLAKLTDHNWPPGNGNWVWGFDPPNLRNDLSVMISNQSSSYSIQTKNFANTLWHTIDYSIINLGAKKADRRFILSIPPGEGDVYFKRVWTE